MKQTNQQVPIWDNRLKNLPEKQKHPHSQPVLIKELLQPIQAFVNLPDRNERLAQHFQNS